jgi:hypothetical protein
MGQGGIMHGCVRNIGEKGFTRFMVARHKGDRPLGEFSINQPPFVEVIDFLRLGLFPFITFKNPNPLLCELRNSHL